MKSIAKHNLLNRSSNVKPTVCLGVLLTLFLSIGSFANADTGKDRKNADREIASQIQRAGLRKIYVSDFLDISGSHAPAGAVEAGLLSRALAESKKGFEVADRAVVHDYLDKQAWSDQDLKRNEVAGKVVSEFGVDGVLGGTISLLRGSFILDLRLRTVDSEKELFRKSFEFEGEKEFLLVRPAAVSPSGRIYYFLGVDGVTAPKCRRCEPPSYPPDPDTYRIQGTVLLLVMITDTGAVEGVRLLRTLEPSFDAAAMKAVKGWQFEPARTPNGHPFATATQIEVTFAGRRRSAVS